ncbi:hypothetical protein K523DRAFT_73348 [Schizophyllum commune Tattone D]|nr:hypothetical protein K523DRAFT_73348 [Schizophyllum commune Tattone D]
MPKTLRHEALSSRPDLKCLRHVSDQDIRILTVSREVQYTLTSPPVCPMYRHRSDSSSSNFHFRDHKAAAAYAQVDLVPPRGSLLKVSLRGGRDKLPRAKSLHHPARLPARRARRRPRARGGE